MKIHPHNYLGFTLVEMIVTLAMLGILASLAAPTLQLAIRRQKEQTLKNSLIEVRTAIDEYKKAVDEGKVQKTGDASGYPPDLKLLYQGVIDISDPNKEKKIFFLRRIPKDPFFPDAAALGEDTWGLRSYESAYNAPSPGKDVFDIYSISPEQAIDGSYYKNW